jgi:ankyrin repeat protein
MRLTSTVVLVVAAVAIVWSFAAGHRIHAQAPAKVDFARDVQPVLQQNCVGCHGASQQLGGLRLDRRSSVFKAGARRVVPGGLENSLVYHRLIGNGFGRQMPPTGALPPEQITVIRTWIEQGAEWPDALANEADLPPLDAKAVAMVDALRRADRAAFMKFVAEEPALLNARGPEGSTPFMYAVLYTDAAVLERLLKMGANPNLANDAKATALMWAATDLAKTRVLLDHGADVNVVSADLRTALMVAAGRPGGAPVVKLLLDRGANPNATLVTSPLMDAAMAGDAATMELLLARGVDVKTFGGGALGLAARSSCAKCVEMLVATNLEPAAYTRSLSLLAYLGDVNMVRLALDRGADVKAVDGRGRTPLMYAAISDFEPLAAMQLLIERGADVNARSRHENSGDTGKTALDLAKLRGATPMVELLAKSGATSTPSTSHLVPPQPATTIRTAVERSLPLLQHADENFIPKSGCVSCHNNSLSAMTMALARTRAFALDEQIAAAQVKANVTYLEQKRDLLHQGAFFGAAQGDPQIASYILIGLDAERHKADLNTDAVAMFVRNRQMPDGRWAFGTDSRPPLCADGDISGTVLALRALQLYAPNVDKPEYESAVRRAAVWLASAHPRTDDDRSWRLLGLAWANTDKGATQRALREMVAAQRADGGWSDLTTMVSTAYATGKTLFALHTAGLPTSDPAYQRGVQFLLKTQMPDGSWFVRTRAAGLQPYFDNGFPYGVDQWISAAGTSWAAMALTAAAPSQAASASVAGNPGVASNR